jgi:ribonuclease E
LPIAKTEQVRSVAVDVAEVISTAPELDSSATSVQPKRNNARRGPNRRRPRNPNYKRPETDGDSNATHDASSVSNGEPRPAGPRSYDNDFAERAERPEHHANAPSQVNNGNQQSEAPKPATVAEPAPKPVEVARQETE